LKISEVGEEKHGDLPERRGRVGKVLSRLKEEGGYKKKIKKKSSGLKRQANTVGKLQGGNFHPRG